MTLSGPLNGVESMESDPIDFAQASVQHSRINDQWRICFIWKDDGPDAGRKGDGYIFPTSLSLVLQRATNQVIARRQTQAVRRSLFDESIESEPFDSLENVSGHFIKISGAGLRVFH